MVKKILIISPVPLFPGRAGNRERIRAICMELMNKDYILDFFYTGFDQEISEGHDSFFNGTVLNHKLEIEKLRFTKNPLLRIREIANGLKIKMERWLRYLKGGSASARFNKSLTEYKNLGKWLLLKGQIDCSSYNAVIVNYAPYSFYFDLFDDETIRIIDTHDRLTDRFNLYTNSSREPVDWHSLTQNDEKQALAKADVVWAITEDEKTFFEKLVDSTSTKVYTLRHLIPFKKIMNQEENNRIVMIGSTNRLNIDGLTWFLEQVWQKIRHYELDLKFLIAGSICEVVDETILDDDVELYGRFDSAEEIYSKGDLFINPMQEGTGLKIKTFEALAKGKFVLSTEAGATGLNELIGNGLICSDHPATWIQEIKEFFETDSTRDDQKKNTAKIISRIYRENLDVIRQSLNFKKGI
jgi:glycosyltransferase involved in cell wall biosynthesis